FCRFDEDVKAFVGYLPSLQVYAQARSKERLPEALRVTALQFIIACADKQILSRVMRDMGCRETKSPLAHAVADQDTEFVAVLGYEECKERVEIVVPLSLLAQQAEYAVL